MTGNKRILTVEDYTLVRQGLKALLDSIPGVEVVGEAGDGREAIEYAERLQPDLILMDLSMPKTDGMTAIKEIKRRYPGIKVLALTVHKAEGYVRRALEAGADGYILKDASLSELERAVGMLLDGKSYLSPGISEEIIKGFRSGTKAGDPNLLDRLTSREVEILKLIAEGYKNREISDYLHISIKTVDKHRENIMKKLNVHNSAGLTFIAVQQGLIEKDSSG
jgi:DNA-binding NarL/FixJ family response regulator